MFRHSLSEGNRQLVVEVSGNLWLVQSLAQEPDEPLIIGTRNVAR